MHWPSLPSLSTFTKVFNFAQTVKSCPSPSPLSLPQHSVPHLQHLFSPKLNSAARTATTSAEASAPAISSNSSTLQSTNGFLKSILSKTPYVAVLGVGAVVCSFAYIKVFYNAPIHRISPGSIRKVTAAICSIRNSPPSQLSLDTLCAMHDYLAALKELLKRMPNMDEPAGSRIWHGKVRSSGYFARFISFLSSLAAPSSI